MLDIKYIRNNINKVNDAIQKKQIELNLDELIEIDDRRLQLIKDLQLLQEEKNRVAKQVPEAKDNAKEELIKRGKELNHAVSNLKEELDEVQEVFQNLMWLVPNIPAEFAPIGENENQNKIIRTHGEPDLPFKPRGHIELMELNGWGNFDRAVKIAGERGYCLHDELLLVEIAVQRLALMKLRGKGFKILNAPAFGRDFAFIGTGHFPKSKEQMYFLEREGLYLSGTGEIFINSYHRGEILKEDELTKLYGVIGPCFRREAGSAGKDVGGLMRVHQFNKVEQYIICKNDLDETMKWHKFILDIGEEILQDLELPYQVVECSIGDMGLGKYRMNDIEAWVPSENRYRETHSCSTLLDWQARRTNLRYRDKNGDVQFCHTLNCTAIATPRILIPLMENHQKEDGTVVWPKAIRDLL